MAPSFSDPDYKAGLDAVNAATNRLSDDVGKLGTTVSGVASRVADIAAKLAAAPTPEDVATAASQLQAHAATLNAVSDSIDQAEVALDAIAANPAEPVPVTPPVEPVPPPA